MTSKISSAYSLLRRYSHWIALGTGVVVFLIGFLLYFQEQQRPGDDQVMAQVHAQRQDLVAELEEVESLLAAAHFELRQELSTVDADRVVQDEQVMQTLSKSLALYVGFEAQDYAKALAVTLPNVTWAQQALDTLKDWYDSRGDVRWSLIETEVGVVSVAGLDYEYLVQATYRSPDSQQVPQRVLMKVATTAEQQVKVMELHRFSSQSNADLNALLGHTESEPSSEDLLRNTHQ